MRPLCSPQNPQTGPSLLAQACMCHPTLSPNSDAYKLSSPTSRGPTWKPHPLLRPCRRKASLPNLPTNLVRATSSSPGSRLSALPHLLLCPQNLHPSPATMLLGRLSPCPSHVPPTNAPTHPLPRLPRPGNRDLSEELAQPEDAASAVTAPLRAPAQRRGGPVAALRGLPQRPPPAAAPAPARVRGRLLRATSAPRSRRAGRAQARATPEPRGRARAATIGAEAAPTARPWPRRRPEPGARGRAAANGRWAAGARALPGSGRGATRGAQERGSSRLLAGGPPAPSRDL